MSKKESNFLEGGDWDDLVAKYKKYSDEFKEAMIQKILVNPGRSVKSISSEAGIPSTTLTTWKDKYFRKRGLDLPKNKINKLTAMDKFNFVISVSSMNEAEKNEYCRKQGLYPQDIEQWRQDCIAGCQDQSAAAAIKQNRQKERKWEKEARRLKKELNRKNKALAETAALLVLKKKAREIWGDQEDDS